MNMLISLLLDLAYRYEVMFVNIHQRARGI